ncbi:hypothetical protein C2845_PM16G00340 [Panicum miliaceum]|uniref:Uncharacterized protein n=1 Tax=Panicum miliaceum TaxID=4540 RepID=A0A3L6Q1I0_PANMI|nr:hypothetical protein C2845_PM16G00340 [Panicum miliaceum]
MLGANKILDLQVARWLIDYRVGTNPLYSDLDENKKEAIVEFLQLWNQLSDVQLSDEEDIFTRRWTRDGCYSAKSAYELLQQGKYDPPRCRKKIQKAFV